MKRLQRFTSRLTASFDWLVQQVENHEALVNNTIQEVAHHSAKATIQLRRVEKDGAKLRHQVLELQKSVQQWEERARETRESDVKTALECLKRKKKADKELSLVETQLTEHSKTEDQLKRELAVVNEKLEELKRKRNMMRTRQSRALAVAACPDSEAQLVSEIEDVFERWDARVTEYELQSGNLHEIGRDELEEKFESEEEEKALLAELNSLTK